MPSLVTAGGGIYGTPLTSQQPWEASVTLIPDLLTRWQRLRAREPPAHGLVSEGARARG